MKLPPLRAVGGNVLLRSVATDVHRGGLIIHGAAPNNILQVGEVIGMGSRWTQDRPWQPPMPTIKRGVLNNGKPDPDWTPPDLSQRPAIIPGRFAEGHREWLELLQPGDLVIYTKSRAYDVFVYEDQDIIVYPGNWIHGIVEKTSLNEHPELRRYMRDSFDTEEAKARPTSPKRREEMLYLQKLLKGSG